MEKSSIQSQWDARRVGVFLSSKSGLPESYRLAAEAVGEWIGRTGRTLVYGGARKGLMEVLAERTHATGGRVYGVVPQIIVERGLVSEHIDVTFHCADLSDRKAIMVRESDVLLALPGGIGTLDEVFTVLAAGTIGLESKPVVLCNIDGCWDSLLAALADLETRGLVSSRLRSQLVSVESVDALTALFV